MSSAGCKKSNGASSLTACSECRRMIRHSLSEWGPGLCRMASRIPILPMSWSREPRRIWTMSASLMPRVRARSSIAAVTWWLWATVAQSRSSIARPALDDVIIGRRESTGILLGWDETTTGRRCIGGDGAREGHAGQRRLRPLGVVRRLAPILGAVSEIGGMGDAVATVALESVEGTIGLISRQEARERRIVTTVKPFRWNPVGNQSRPVEPDQQPEASLAWWVGDHPCEA